MKNDKFTKKEIVILVLVGIGFLLGAFLDNLTNGGL